jgi:hypothetical protein
MKKLIEPIFIVLMGLLPCAGLAQTPGKLIAVTGMFPMCLGPDDGTPGDVEVRGRFGQCWGNQFNWVVEGTGAFGAQGNLIYNMVTGSRGKVLTYLPPNSVGLRNYETPKDSSSPQLWQVACGGTNFGLQWVVLYSLAAGACLQADATSQWNPWGAYVSPAFDHSVKPCPDKCNMNSGTPWSSIDAKWKIFSSASFH